jgi:hypothetical protein
MFYLFKHPIIILFDYGVLHDFMSLACAQKVKLTLWAIKLPYSISTPGGRVVVDCMVHKMPRELVGQLFSTRLIILECQGIYVILGMNWMKIHKAVLDIIAHLVHLDSPIFGKISLQFPPVAHLQSSIHVVVVKSLDEIPVVREYPDVFPDDFLVMPPDRAIEFKIKLQHGTAAVYTQPYPMTSNKLAEMKIQLQELLDKGYIRPSCSSWVCPALFVKKRDKTLCMYVDYRPLNVVAVKNKYSLPTLILCLIS